MRWNEKTSNYVCGGEEEQCYRNMLQYCAIREYSYEIAHEFVHCVQT